MRFLPGLWSATLICGTLALARPDSIAHADQSHPSYSTPEWRKPRGADGIELQSLALQRVFLRTKAVIKLWNLPEAHSISVDASNHASAFVYQSTKIRVSKPLLDVLHSEEEIAFAISHEMAHIALGHTTKSGASAELIADAFAVDILNHMGMDPCASTTTLEALQEREPLYREQLGERLEHLRNRTLGRCSRSPHSRMRVRKSGIETIIK